MSNRCYEGEKSAGEKARLDIWNAAHKSGIGERTSANSQSQASLVYRLRNEFYYSRPGWVGGTTEFHDLLKKFITVGASILELGAGPPNKHTAFLATLGDVTGLDIDHEVSKNHFCSETIVYDGVSIPVPSATYDVAVSNYVCEHIEYPLELTTEIRRVLKSGGVYIFRTPNLWHYGSLIAKITPHWFHRLVSIRRNRYRYLPADAHRTYRTYYRMNTIRACRKILQQAGFTIVVLRCIEKEPCYAIAPRLTFYPMMMWERILNSSKSFELLRDNILCVAMAQ